MRRRARDVVVSRDARAAMENNETRALLAIRAVGVSMSIDDASSCADRGVASSGDVDTRYLRSAISTRKGLGSAYYAFCYVHIRVFSVHRGST